MVGVSKSTGCDTCRKRKIKCDGMRPSCQRCLHAGISCPGYHLRFKFHAEGNAPKRKSRDRNASDEPDRPSRKLPPLDNANLSGTSSLEVIPPHTVQDVIHRRLQANNRKFLCDSVSFSKNEKLALMFCETFRPELPLEKSLSSFGLYIFDIPRRLGVNEALDLSVNALCLAHRALLSGSKYDLMRSRIKYGQALIQLQQCLEFRDLATSEETLCATMFLAKYELIAPTNDMAVTRHVAGASRLISMRGPDRFNTGFARKMLRAPWMKGIMVIEAILCRKECFLDLPTWRPIGFPVDETYQQPVETLFDHLTSLPNILISLGEIDATSIPSSSCFSLLERATELRERLIIWREDPCYASLFQTISEVTQASLFPIHIRYTSAHAARLLCTFSASMILLHRIISQLSSSDAPGLEIENKMFAAQICGSYDYYKECSPLGYKTMSFSLKAAYLVVTAREKREWIVSKVEEIERYGVDRGTEINTTWDQDSFFDLLRMRKV